MPPEQLAQNRPATAKRKKSPLADWGILKPLIEEIMKATRHFPSDKELAALHRYDVRNAIRAHHGGFVAAQEKFGLNPKPHGRAGCKRTPGSLRDWANFEKEARRLLSEHGTFPSTYWLERHGSGRVASAVRFHGGIREVRKKMGDANFRVAKGGLKEWENAKARLERLQGNLGHFPTFTECVATGNRHLLKMLSKYHGGLEGAKERVTGMAAVRSPINITDGQKEAYLAAKKWADESSDCKAAGAASQKAAVRLISYFQNYANYEAEKFGLGNWRKDALQQVALYIIQKLRKSATAEDFYSGIIKGIRGTIASFNRETKWLHLSHKEECTGRVIRKAIKLLEKKNQREPSALEISQATNIPVPEIAELLFSDTPLELHDVGSDGTVHLEYSEQGKLSQGYACSSDEG